MRRKHFNAFAGNERINPAIGEIIGAQMMLHSILVSLEAGGAMAIHCFELLYFLLLTWSTATAKMMMRPFTTYCQNAESKSLGMLGN
jgi:hypothetical protein